MQMAYCCTKCSLIRDEYLESDLLRRPIKNLEKKKKKLNNDNNKWVTDSGG